MPNLMTMHPTMTNPNKKRGYAGWKLVQNTVLDYLEPDGSTKHTALQIAKEQGLNPASVRIAARRIGVNLKPSPRGGLRIKGVKGATR